MSEVGDQKFKREAKNYIEETWYLYLPYVPLRGFRCNPVSAQIKHAVQFTNAEVKMEYKAVCAYLHCNPHAGFYVLFLDNSGKRPPLAINTSHVCSIFAVFIANMLKNHDNTEAFYLVYARFCS